MTYKNCIAGTISLKSSFQNTIFQFYKKTNNNNNKNKHAYKTYYALSTILNSLCVCKYTYFFLT